MNTWDELVKHYLFLAAPYIVPPLALLFATFLFKFILSNKKTRQYAKLLMNVMRGKLETAVGAEKSKQILDAWNEVIREVENESDDEFQAQSENHFLTRIKNMANLTPEEAEHVQVILQWLRGEGNDVGIASTTGKYKLPKLPHQYEL